MNEPLFDIETLSPFFERSFGDPRVMQQWFAEELIVSGTSPDRFLCARAGASATSMRDHANRLGSSASRLVRANHLIETPTEAIVDGYRKITRKLAAVPSISEDCNHGYLPEDQADMRLSGG